MTVRVGLDLDGVVYDWGGRVRELMREHRGIDLDESDRWNYIKESVPPEDWRWLWSEGVLAHGLFRCGRPYPGALQAVRRLAQNARIVVVTHRPRTARVDTLAWLAHYQLPVDEVHVLSEGEPKSSVPADIYVDDGPHVVDDLAENTSARVFLWDRPWNQGAVPRGVRRATSWSPIAYAVASATIPGRIVGVTGYKRTGKDTVAGMLVERHGYERIGLADPLKDMALAIDPKVVVGAEVVGAYPPHVMHRAVPLSEYVGEYGWEDAKKNSDVRGFLQRLGTEGVRNHLGENAWVDALRRRMRPGGHYVVPDVRFPNEADAIRDMGGVVWRVQRPGFGPDSHPSERCVDRIDPDYIIENTGTLDDLRREVDAVLSALLNGQEAA